MTPQGILGGGHDVKGRGQSHAVTAHPQPSQQAPDPEQDTPLIVAKDGDNDPFASLCQVQSEAFSRSCPNGFGSATDGDDGAFCRHHGRRLPTQAGSLRHLVHQEVNRLSFHRRHPFRMDDDRMGEIQHLLPSHLTLPPLRSPCDYPADKYGNAE
jgi:hypothetical protein